MALAKIIYWAKAHEYLIIYNSVFSQLKLTAIEDRP